MEGLNVSIRAAFGAEIILSNSSTGETPHVRIFLGDELNTRSSIEEDGEECSQPFRCVNNSTGVLSQFEFREFQIFWNLDSFITVMRDSRSFLIIKRVNNFEVSHVGVKTK